MPQITENDADFQQELSGAGLKLVVAQMTASWCGACKGFVSSYDELSMRYSNAVFLSVDVEKCEGTGLHFRVNAMPTFVLIRNKQKLDQIEGANKEALESKIKSYYTGADADNCGVKGMIELNSFLTKKDCECLNEADDHPFGHCLEDGVGGYLESDCDEQIILSLAFNQAVKVHSLKIMAPSDKGPKNIRIFMNQPNTLDFDGADSMIATQDITLTPGQLDGSPITLKFVKFQNVQNLQLFIKDNQIGDEITQIDYLGIIGTPIGTTNMNDFKRVAGKGGEGH
jgi:thiol-disulfide isomerase/thioredoxin